MARKNVTTNKMNRFWNNGILPIKKSVIEKMDASKVVNTLLTTAAGFALDARQGKILDDKVTALNSKLPVMQSGTGTLSYVNYAVCIADVTFPKSFSTEPKIIITPRVPPDFESNRNSITQATYLRYAVSNTGFQIRAYSADGYDFFSGESIQFHWIAIQ